MSVKKCKNYKEFKKAKKKHIYDKKLFLSSISNKCGSEGEKIFNEEKLFKILKVLGLINNM